MKKSKKSADQDLIKSLEKDKVNLLKKIENLENEILSFKNDKVIIDLKNEDNFKTLKDLIKENKILINNSKKFIAATQISPIYDKNKVIHKIYIDDIKNIIVKKYYEDMCLVEKGNRTLNKVIIWCYHSGYNSFSIISQEDLDYLLENFLISENIVKYSFIN